MQFCKCFSACMIGWVHFNHTESDGSREERSPQGSRVGSVCCWGVSADWPVFYGEGGGGVCSPWWSHEERRWSWENICSICSHILEDLNLENQSQIRCFLYTTCLWAPVVRWPLALETFYSSWSSLRCFSRMVGVHLSNQSGCQSKNYKVTRTPSRAQRLNWTEV